MASQVSVKSKKVVDVDLEIPRFLNNLKKTGSSYTPGANVGSVSSYNINMADWFDFNVDSGRITNVVSIEGDQTISGSKTFSSDTITLSGIPTYADDAAAGTGGLTEGQIYQTATGELRIKTA